MGENKKAEKTAIVFDTNAIYQFYNQFGDIIPKVINNNYLPYIPQLVIYEYKKKFAREFKSNTKGIMNKFNPYIEYKDKKNFDDILQDIQSDIQSNLELLFENRIIKYDESNDTFKRIINRALEKIPPFSDDNEKAKSDKGFKDTIIWLSVIEYFKNQGENNVIFISDDKVFVNNSILVNEFKSHTNKNITIKTNEEFLKMIAYDENKKSESFALKNNDLDIEHNIERFNYTDKEISRIRDEIEHIMYEMCLIPRGYDYEMVPTFVLSYKIDAIYVKNILSNLAKNIYNHLLDESISITAIMDNDVILKSYYKIDITSCINLLNLYKEMKQDYPSLLPQFYGVVARLINQYCYIETRNDNDNNVDIDMSRDDEVPF